MFWPEDQRSNSQYQFTPSPPVYLLYVVFTFNNWIKHYSVHPVPRPSDTHLFPGLPGCIAAGSSKTVSRELVKGTHENLMRCVLMNF